MLSEPLKNDQLRDPNRRHFKRVAVVLPGAICPRHKKAELINTINISEGGICITYEGLTVFKAGSEISLQLKGMLYSGPQRKLDIYKMQVIYHTKNKIGLKFTYSI